jgi:hypothetical protein
MLETNQTTYTDHYVYGYADALNEQINLQAFTHSAQYQRGYEDALHDCNFTQTYTDHDTF